MSDAWIPSPVRLRMMSIVFNVAGNRLASRTTIHSMGSTPGTNWNGASTMISGHGL